MKVPGQTSTRPSPSLAWERCPPCSSCICPSRPCLWEETILLSLTSLTYGHSNSWGRVLAAGTGPGSLGVGHSEEGHGGWILGLLLQTLERQVCSLSIFLSV